jgi:predicted permease
MVAAVQMETFFADMRYAIRQLRRSPGFTVAVVLTLALAIGANTAIFSVVNAVLLRPIPYADSPRLLAVWHGTANGYPWYTFSHPRFRYFQEHSADIAELAAYDDESVTLADRDEPVRVEGGRVSANFFSLLGVKPVLGRTFLPAEDAHGAAPVVLLSHRIWHRRYGANRKILGQTVGIDGEAFTIIGVLPPGFQFQGEAVDVWRSRIIDTRTFAPASVQLGAAYLTAIARLRPGVTLAQARAKFQLLGSQYSQINPGNSDVIGQIQTDSLQTKLFAPVHLTVLVLWGAVICLLAIACANVANLVLARATARYRDVSIRIALGASRGRIAQQLVTDSNGKYSSGVGQRGRLIADCLSGNSRACARVAAAISPGARRSSGCRHAAFYSCHSHGSGRCHGSHAIVRAFRRESAKGIAFRGPQRLRFRVGYTIAKRYRCGAIRLLSRLVGSCGIAAGELCPHEHHADWPTDGAYSDGLA